MLKRSLISTLRHFTKIKNLKKPKGKRWKISKKKIKSVGNDLNEGLSTSQVTTPRSMFGNALNCPEPGQNNKGRNSKARRFFMGKSR